MKQTDFSEQLTQALDLRVCCFCSSVPWAKEKALRLRGRPEGKKRKPLRQLPLSIGAHA